MVAPTPRLTHRNVRFDEDGTVPFPDEAFADRVHVVDYQDRWLREGLELVESLRDLVPEAVSIDHIGSTAVPGLAAKDCLDAMIRVPSLAGADLVRLARAGYRERPEHWNREEALDGRRWPKRVFAPPAGGRSVNVHVREHGSATARYALLFRDFLRADAEARQTWARFKVRLAETATDLYSYGQIKATAQPLLMTLAEEWAVATAWRP